jgi:hypothetical protein
MPTSIPIVSLTSNLLAVGAFSHLTDEKVSSLYHLLLCLQEPLSKEQAQIMLQFWQHADATTISAALLHRCNSILSQFRFPPLEWSTVNMH